MTLKETSSSSPKEKRILLVALGATLNSQTKFLTEPTASAHTAKKHRLPPWKKTVEVLRYQLPKMRIKTEFPRKYYTPHEKPSFKIKVLYPYGSPVSQAKVQIQVIDENHKNYLQGNSELQTNAQGECEGTFSFLSLDSPLENPLSLYFITRVEDTAEQVVHHSTPPLSF
jgi:hypothetical protein